MNVWEIGLILLFLGLILIFSLLNKRMHMRALRPIQAITELRKTIELSVEDGSRLQISLGRGGLLGPQSAAAFAGISLLRQVARIASDSDQPPIATAGEGTLFLLAQDTLRRTYQDLGISENYHHRLGRQTGLTPFSYAAGTLPLILDKSVSASAIVGSFGEEAALITSASQKQGAFTFGGSDSLSSQAILFASAEEPLIGEELYATGAYLDAGVAHEASLQTQDVFRWLIIFAITGLAIGKVLGLIL